MLSPHLPVGVALQAPPVHSTGTLPAGPTNDPPLQKHIFVSLLGPSIASAGLSQLGVVIGVSEKVTSSGIERRAPEDAQESGIHVPRSRPIFKTIRKELPSMTAIDVTCWSAQKTRRVMDESISEWRGGTDRRRTRGVCEVLTCTVYIRARARASPSNGHTHSRAKRNGLLRPQSRSK